MNFDKNIDFGETAILSQKVEFLSQSDYFFYWFSSYQQLPYLKNKADYKRPERSHAY